MRRSDLHPDCARCAALCCVVFAFDASDDFATSKPAGVRCMHLANDARCTIHDDLVERGYRGCAIYDCFGAGPRVTREMLPGDGAVVAVDVDVAHAFSLARVVYETLFLLTEAAKMPAAAPLATELDAMITVFDTLTRTSIARWHDADVHAQHRAAHALLRRIGDLVGGPRAHNARLRILR